MPGRDPAFLYYDADVALDVAHMNRLEKGCYLDLVQLYKRYHGYTMVQLRYILGNDFESVWNALALVLIQDGDKYHIQWLRNSLAKKAEKSKTQAQNVKKRWEKEKNGITMVIPTYSNGNTDEQPEIDSGNTNVIPIIVTETETKDRKEDDVGGMGEAAGEGKGFSDGGPPEPEGHPWPEHASHLPNSMVEIFVAVFPGYPKQPEKDFAACLQIGYQLADLNGWPWQSALNGRMPEVLEQWRQIVQWIKTSSWFRTKSLSFLNDKFQDLIQAKNDGTNKNATGSGERVGTSAAQINALRNLRESVLGSDQATTD